MKLIINADDFGLSKSITDGIVEGIKEGVLTSTSIMANMDYAKYAVKQAVANGINSIGLHINLTVGKPIILNAHLTDAGGRFFYNRKQIDENKALTYEDVYNEVKAQIGKVESLSGGKVKVDHLTTHHFLYNNEIMRRAIFDIARELGLPMRNEYGYTFDNIEDAKGIKMPNKLCASFTIENVNSMYLKNLVEKFRKENVVVEIATHSGYIDDYTKTVTSYIGRADELKVLREVKNAGVFEGIELISFSQL